MNPLLRDGDGDGDGDGGFTSYVNNKQRNDCFLLNERAVMGRDPSCTPTLLCLPNELPASNGRKFQALRKKMTRILEDDANTSDDRGQCIIELCNVDSESALKRKHKREMDHHHS